MRIVPTVAAVLTIVAGVPAALAADCSEQASKQTPEQVVDEIVGDAKASEPGGEAYASTGPATPKENWFGCAPGSSAEHCEPSAKGQPSGAAAERSRAATETETAAAGDQSERSGTEGCGESEPG